MRGHRLRLAVILGVLTLFSGAIWWVAPQGAAQQQLRCDFRQPQPGHPLEMNTVVSDPRTSQFQSALIKHVVMEKEIYDCVEDPGTDQERRFTRDVQTFIEIIQKAQGGRTVTLEKRVEETVCDKPTGSAFQISCSARDVPLQETGPPFDFQCVPTTQELGARPQPTDTVEMNTVITSRQDTIKTMKVDKELLACQFVPGPGGGEFFGDLYLFTEIVEARSATPADTIRPTEKKFQAILCEQLFDTRRIDRCNHFIPSGVNG